MRQTQTFLKNYFVKEFFLCLNLGISSHHLVRATTKNIENLPFHRLFSPIPRMDRSWQSENAKSQNARRKDAREEAYKASDAIYFSFFILIFLGWCSMISRFSLRESIWV